MLGADRVVKPKGMAYNITRVLFSREAEVALVLVVTKDVFWNSIF